jgi:hypothetical protein
MRINGNPFTPILDSAMITPGFMATVNLGRGQNEISIDANASIFDINSNPGLYELQIFENDYTFTQTERDILNIVFPILPETELNKTVSSEIGQTVSLSAPHIGGMDRFIEWRQISGPIVETSDIYQENISFEMPEQNTNENIVFEAMVTSTRGKVISTQTVSENAQNQNSTTPSPVIQETSSSGSSGGVSNVLTLLMLLSCLVCRVRQRTRLVVFEQVPSQ